MTRPHAGGCPPSKTSKPSWEAAVLATKGISKGNWWPLCELVESSTDAVDITTGSAAYVANGNPVTNQTGIIPNSPFGSRLFNPASYFEETATWAQAINPPYSMSAVIKGDAIAGTALGIMGLMDTYAGNGTRASAFLDTTGKLVCGQDTAGGPFNSVIGTNNLLDGKAHLIGYTFNLANIFTGWEDGISIGAINPGAIPSDPVVPVIGWATAGSNGAANNWYWNGWIQSVIYWADELQASDWANLFTASGL